jgi:hypothetical protein
VATTPPWGSYLYLCCQGRHDNNQAGRGEIHPRFPGEGVLMRYSSRPSDCCKGRSEPSTENSSDAPPRFGPLAPEDRARRLAELRTALAGAAPTFQARLLAREQGEQTP